MVEGDVGSCIYKGHVYIYTAYLRRSRHLLDDEHDGVVRFGLVPVVELEPWKGFVPPRVEQRCHGVAGGLGTHTWLGYKRVIGWCEGAYPAFRQNILAKPKGKRPLLLHKPSHVTSRVIIVGVKLEPAQ